MVDPGSAYRGEGLTEENVDMAVGKEFVFTGEALRTDSWLKCGSFEGGAPSGMMCTTHKKMFLLSCSFF